MDKNRPHALFTPITNRDTAIDRGEFNLLLRTVERLQQSIELPGAQRAVRLLKVEDEDSQTAYIMRGKTEDDYSAATGEGTVNYDLWKYDRVLLRTGVFFQAWYNAAEGSYIPFDVDTLIDFVLRARLGAGGSAEACLLENGVVDESYQFTVHSKTNFMSSDENDGVPGTARWDIKNQVYSVIQLSCDDDFPIESSQSSGEGV